MGTKDLTPMEAPITRSIYLSIMWDVEFDGDIYFYISLKEKSRPGKITSNFKIQNIF